MNRLTNYLKSKELAKIHIATATEALRKAEERKAISHLIGAIENTLVAQNCLVSLAFEKRKILKKRIRKQPNVDDLHIEVNAKPL